MINGKSINYYLDSSVEYTISIPNAAYNLMYPDRLFRDTSTTNRLTAYRTTTYDYSKMDFTQVYEINKVNATTVSYRMKNSGKYETMNTYEKDQYDWKYVKISINDFTMGKHDAWKREAVILHEMLHGYGFKDLSYYSNRFNIMFKNSGSWESDNLSFPNEINSVLNRKY